VNARERAGEMDVGVCRACESVQPIERIDQGDGLCPDCQRCRDFGNCPRCAYAEGSGVACDWCKPPPAEPENTSSSALIGAERRGPTPEEAASNLLAERDELRRQRDHARRFRDKYQARAIDRTRQRNDARAERASLLAERDELRARYDATREGRDELRGEVVTLRAEAERLREALREIENRLASGRAYAEIVNVWVLVDRVEAIAREATA